MKKILFFMLLIFVQHTLAQNTCETAYPVCDAIGQFFPNDAGHISNTPIGCLSSSRNPTYFYLPVSRTGNIYYQISNRISDNFESDSLPVNYAVWGPFRNLEDVCGDLNDSTLVNCNSGTTSSLVNLIIFTATEGEFYILALMNRNNRSGYYWIERGISSVARIGCSGINLNAFLDSNSNGVRDVAEPDFPTGSFTYRANNEGSYTTTTSTGSYTIFSEATDETTYDIEFNLPAEYSGLYNVSVPSYSDILVNADSDIQTFNFPVTPSQSFQDCRVTIRASESPRPGFTHKDYIEYTNFGSEQINSGTVSYTKDPRVQIVGVSESSAVLTNTGFDFTYTEPLQPLELRRIEVTLQMPVIPDISLGDEITSSVVGTPDDIIPNNNIYYSTQVVVGSYDPNDITESRGSKIYIDNFTNDDYLYYTIRFQNTGTASATYVRIEDMLDAGLDESSVEMLQASHNFVMRKQGNSLIWKFDNIGLPAAQNNEPASHGYVYFRVKPTAGYALGDIIPNTANIYFDFNPAIVTNTFESEFVNTLNSAGFKASNFILYPNPAKNTVHIVPANSGGAVTSVQIHDLTGKTIYTKAHVNGALTIDSSAFASGTYFVDIVNSANAKTVKKLIIE